MNKKEYMDVFGVNAEENDYKMELQSDPWSFTLD